MAIKDEYGGAFRKQLRHFPVWDVGAAVALGDFGVVSDNCFTKLGNILDLGVRPEIDLSSGGPAFFEFTSAGTKVIDVGAQASVAGAKGSLQVNFDSAFSLFVRADQSRVVSMANAERAGNQIKHAVGWERNHCWVSSVRVAKSFVVLMNTQRSSSVRLEGDPGALAEIAAGKVSGSASAAIKVTGDAGLRYLGGAGSIYVDLMHIGLLGGTTPKRGGSGEEGPVALSPDRDIQGG
jgi:hypothetical protein